MLEVKFRYRDRLNYPNWSEQSCIVSSLEECRRIYGLGVDCEYEILSVKTEEEYALEDKAKRTAYDIIQAYRSYLSMPELTNDADKKLAEELEVVLKEKEILKTYKAFEGGFRVIFTDKYGNEYRYVLGENGSLTEKP